MRTLSITLETCGQVVATFVEPTFKEKANLINMAKTLSRLTCTDMTLTACIQESDESLDVVWRSVKYTWTGEVVKLWEQDVE